MAAYTTLKMAPADHQALQEHHTIWVRPSQEAWEHRIKPLVDSFTLEELTKMAGWDEW